MREVRVDEGYKKGLDAWLESNTTIRLNAIEKPIVSRGFRGLPTVVFGVITDDDQVKDDQTTDVIGKGANLIGLRAKLTEETL